MSAISCLEPQNQKFTEYGMAGLLFAHYCVTTPFPLVYFRKHLRFKRANWCLLYHFVVNGTLFAHIWMYAVKPGLFNDTSLWRDAPPVVTANSWLIKSAIS